MRVRLTILSLLLMLATGCAGDGGQASGRGKTSIGDIQVRDPLLNADCRVPCSISPGPGCC